MEPMESGPGIEGGGNSEGWSSQESLLSGEMPLG